MRHSLLDSDRWCPGHASTDWECLDASNESRLFDNPLLPQWSYVVPFQDPLERSVLLTYRARTNAALLAIQELLDESRDDVFATNWAIQVCWRMRSRPSLAPHLKNQKRNKNTSIDMVVQCSRREKERKDLWQLFAVRKEETSDPFKAKSALFGLLLLASETSQILSVKPTYYSTKRTSSIQDTFRIRVDQ